MKKLLLLSLITFNSFAAEFLIYNSKGDTLKNKFNAQDVFTKKEKEFLKDTHVNTNVLIVNVQDEKSFTDYMKQNYPLTKVEKNNKIELFSKEQFEDYQWGLKNDGRIIEDWISDIDVVQTAGVIGEDIGLNEQETNKKITVAIIDSGIDTKHPDLKDQIYSHPKECKALEEYNTCLNTSSNKDICYEKYANFDANGNGYPLDCHGWNITGKSNPISQVEGSGNINDLNGHGTHVSGIIGAKKNKIGIKGVIQNVTLLPIQVSVASKNTNQANSATDKFAKALLYAIRSKAQVINMSLGWRFDQDSLLMRDMIKLAHEKNILIVAAAGNDNHPAPTYPCSYEEVICVGSHTVNGSLSSFSNYGAHVDIIAPGSKILSTWPTNKRSKVFTIDDNYEFMSGTSQAAPFVTGVLARLLNQGLSPKSAKIALLKGARKTIRSAQNYIRHGNVDYTNALKVNTKSFLYPVLKTPSLIRWTENESKKITFKIKNHHEISKNISLNFKLISKSTQPETSLVKQKFTINKLDVNEQKEISLELKSPYDVDGNFLISVDIKSDRESKSYYFQAKAISIVGPDTNEQNQETFEVLGNTEFIKDANINVFKNYTASESNDFLATKKIGDKTHIALIKSEGANYHVTDDFALPIKDPIIINLSKVDLDLDNKADYVITAVNIIDSKTRETKFFALDETFRPKRIFIAPKNTFKNDITVLPGSFFWLRYNDLMVPAWITVGKRPTTERPGATPWANAPVELNLNRLYLQLPDKIKTITFAGDEALPLHFLYQSQDKRRSGEAMIIVSEGFGYFKQYKLYKFKNGVKFVQNINLERYFDLASARPLPVAKAMSMDHAFFNTPSILGEHNVIAFKWDELNQKLLIQNKRALTKNKLNPIKHVLSFSDDAIMAQTNSLITSQSDQGVTFEASKVDSRRIKHHILVGQQGLFLSSRLTSGIGSEVIMPYQSNKELYRPASWQKLGYKGCDEVGFTLEGDKDKSVYLCGESRKLYKFLLTAPL